MANAGHIGERRGRRRSSLAAIFAAVAVALAGFTTCGGGKHAMTSNDKDRPDQGTGGQASSTPRDGEPIYLGTLDAEPLVIESVEWEQDTPFSAREAINARQVLAANGFERTPAHWRRAAASDNEVFRALGFLLLARQAQREDQRLFRTGLADVSPAVRVWAAWGVIQLGDASARSVLEDIARQKPDFGQYAPLMAIGLLGELGDAGAFALLEHHVRTLSERNAVIIYALPFAALHGQEYAPGKRIDIWVFYDTALRDSDERVVYVALEQSRELSDPASHPVLDGFIARGGPAHLVRKAGAIRQSIAAVTD